MAAASETTKERRPAVFIKCLFNKTIPTQNHKYPHKENTKKKNKKWEKEMNTDHKTKLKKFKVLYIQRRIMPACEV